MNSHIKILEDIIENRRTVKPTEFTGEKIDDSIIEKILNSANWAPTHGYTEPWRFSIFAEDGLARLGDFYAKLDQPHPDSPDFNSLRFDKLRNRPMACSHVIGIGMKRGNNPKVPEIEEIASVAMAVQNIWLSAYAHGVSGYWSTGSLAFKEEMRDFFGLDEGDKSLGLFYLGKSSSPHPQGRRLSPIEDKIKWRRS